MGKGSGRHSGNGGDGRGGLGHEDFLLWKAFTHDVDPLEETYRDARDEATPAAPQQKPSQKTFVEKLFAPLAKRDRDTNIDASGQPAQLDARTDARLRRGQMPVEGRLDLHGCTQEQAHRKLNEFVADAHARGKRCVLVITGKGSSRGGEEHSVGILRQKLPLWLSMPSLRGIVLKAYPAARRDGGTGAWYLYLRRQRDY